MNRSVRVRLTSAYLSTAVVLIAIGALVFRAGVHIGVDRSLDEQLRSRAVRTARIVQRDGPSGVHTMTPSQSDVLTELIGPAGGLVAASSDLPSATLLDGAQSASARESGGGFWSVGAGPDYRLYAEPARTSAGVWLVVVATPLREQNELADTVTGLLVISAGVLLLFGGLGAWLLAGAALRPVERLRREVAAISESDPTSRVRVPATGDEIAALAETMNALLARISNGLAEQRQFVADASHELRAPLANMRFTLELATRRARTPDELAEAIGFCEQEAIRLGHLVDDVLVLAAADDRVMVDQLPDQLVEPLLEAAVAAARPTAGAKEVELRVVSAPGLVAALHPGLIRQLLDNLLANAIRHTRPGSEVLVTAEADGTGLVIEVADEGPGFPAGFAEHAFERFRRAGVGDGTVDGDGGGDGDGDGGDGDGESERGKGSGLGLAVVQAIAAAHGGAAKAGNRPTGGAAVRVGLPRTRQAAAVTPVVASKGARIMTP